MIFVQNIIDGKNGLFTIIFDANVLRHLKCKCDDYLVILQSHFNTNHFIIVKSENGYRIRRYSKIKKHYQVNLRYIFKNIPEFDYRQCDFFIKKDKVRIILKFD